MESIYFYQKYLINITDFQFDSNSVSKKKINVNKYYLKTIKEMNSAKESNIPK